jgi:hypothetical protein
MERLAGMQNVFVAIVEEGLLECWGLKEMWNVRV